MSRKIQTQRVLKEASNHLFYELQMLEGCYSGIKFGIAGQSILNNALIESFVMHARVLFHFYYPDKPWTDDIIAEDFFQKPAEWISVRPPESEISKKARNRVGKEAAHLTYARLWLTSEEKDWALYFDPIIEGIRHNTNIFLKNVSINNLSELFLKMINKAEEINA